MTGDGLFDRRRFLVACGLAVSGCAGDGGVPGAPRDDSETVSPTAPRRDSATATATAESSAATEPEQSAATESASLGSPESWPMAGYDARNTGYNPTADGPTESPTQYWQTNVAGYNTMAPAAFADGNLYLASGEEAYGVDLTTGGAGWEQSVSYLTHYAAPALATVDGTRTMFLATRTGLGALNGGGSGRLYALAGASGDVQWTVDAPISGPPTTADDRVFLTSSTSSTGRIDARSQRTGESLWTHTVESESAGSDTTATAAYAGVAVTDDAVFAPTTRSGDETTGELLTLSPADGTVRRRRAVAGAVRAAPVVGDDTVFLGTNAGVVAAFPTDGGDPSWQQSVDGEIWSRPVLADGRLFVLNDREVVAFDAGDGAVQWRRSLPPARGSELATDGETLYIGGNYLTALSTADGSRRFQLPVPDGQDGGWGSPVVVGEAVAVGICIKSAESGGLYDDVMSVFV